MITEVERMVGRGLLILVLAPFLVFSGLGVGRLTHRALALPEDVPVRSPSDREVPRERLEALSREMQRLRASGERTADYVRLYQEHVAPIEASLRRRDVPAATARQIAWPLVEYSYMRGLDPATVLAVLLVESEGRPRARSPVGARGLMQVMPWWAGRIEGCGRDLYAIEDNLCAGTWILAEALGRLRSERRALLSYNGCVTGSFTPDCHRYPDKVASLRRQILAEWGESRPAAPRALAEE
ncbi:MAG TPA: transglycosylase SLT domain-containing protein [Longimicrobiales bacterium]